MQTEVDTVNNPLSRSEENARPDILQADDLQSLGEMVAAQMIEDIYDAATYRPPGVADTRVTQRDLALRTYWMSIPAIEVVSGDNH